MANMYRNIEYIPSQVKNVQILMLDHPWQQNDQYFSFFVEWIIKNPIFHWHFIYFLLEAVEASQYYFFENWLMKLKCPNLPKPLGTIIQENYGSYNPSEPFRILRFNMRHPVGQLIWPIFLFFLALNFNLLIFLKFYHQIGMKTCFICG